MLTKNEMIFRAIPVSKLLAILRHDVGPDHLIAVSPVGELLELDKDEKPVGMISLSAETYEAFDEGK